MASYALLMFTMGKIGPNISSCMTGSVDLTSIRIVGSMYLSEESVLPPIATVPFDKNFDKRLKTRVSINYIFQKCSFSASGSYDKIIKINSLEVIVAYNAAQIRTFLWIFGIPFLNNFLRFLDKLILHFSGA